MKCPKCKQIMRKEDVLSDNLHIICFNYWCKNTECEYFGIKRTDWKKEK